MSSADSPVRHRFNWMSERGTRSSDESVFLLRELPPGTVRTREQRRAIQNRVRALLDSLNGTPQGSPDGKAQEPAAKKEEPKEGEKKEEEKRIAKEKKEREKMEKKGKGSKTKAPPS